MIDKLILGGLVVLIGALIGNIKAKKYEKREQVLNESIFVFKSIESQIKYMLMSLPNAIENSRQNLKSELKEVLGAVSTSIIDNSYSDASLVKEMDKIQSLCNYDRQIISNGILALGKADVDTQVSLITNTINILETQLVEATDERRKNYKLYRTVGVVSGMIMAILLI